MTTHVCSRALSWWNNTLFFAKWGLFCFKTMSNLSKSLNNIRQWSFYPFQGNRHEWHRIHPKTLWLLPCWRTDWPWTSLGHVLPKNTILIIPWSLVCGEGVHGNKMPPKVVRIASEYCQKLLWIGHTVVLIVDCKHSRYPSCG